MSYLDWRSVYPAFTSPPGHKGRAEHKVFFFLILHIPHACLLTTTLDEYRFSTETSWVRSVAPLLGTRPTLPATLTPPTRFPLYVLPFMCIFLTAYHGSFICPVNVIFCCTTLLPPKFYFYLLNLMLYFVKLTPYNKYHLSGNEL